jgi:acyl-CoA thioester hydrolase
VKEPPQPPHRWHHTIRIFELDAYRHANHTVYLQWLEEGREGFLESRGLSFLRFLEEGTPLVMVNLDVNYLGQVERGDEARIETWVDRIGRTSVRFGHRILGAKEKPVLEGSATMVFVGADRRPVPVSEAFRAAVAP